MVEGKSRVDAPENNVTIIVHPASSQPEDAKSVPCKNATVQMIEWHDAIRAVLPEQRSEKDQPRGFLKRGKTMNEMIKQAVVANDDLADDRAREQARAALPGYFKKIIGPFELRCYCACGTRSNARGRADVLLAYLVNSTALRWRSISRGQGLKSSSACARSC